MLKMDPPFPLESGTDWVSYHLLRTLALEHEVTYVTLTRSAREQETLRELEKYCARVIWAQQPNVKSLLHRVFYKGAYFVLSVLTGTPMVVWYNTPWALRRKVAQLLDREQFDLIHVEYWYAGPYARYAKQGKRVLLKHDVAYLADERLLSHRPSGPRKWWEKARVAWMKRAEIRECRKFDTVLSVSEPDGNALARLLDGRPDVKTLPALYLPFPETRGRVEDERRLVFLGHLNRGIVIDAVTYFCNAILPRIQEKRPDVVFEVIGRGEDRVRHLARRGGIELTGFVRDVNRRIATAAVMVVPLRAGSGIKIKIIEALVAGLPIVTTSVGAEGIGLTHGREAMIADDPGDFAQCTLDLLADPTRRREMGESGRRFARERYGSREVQKRLLEFYGNEVAPSG